MASEPSHDTSYTAPSPHGTSYTAALAALTATCSSGGCRLLRTRRRHRWLLLLLERAPGGARRAATLGDACAAAAALALARPHLRVRRLLLLAGLAQLGRCSSLRVVCCSLGSDRGLGVVDHPHSSRQGRGRRAPPRCSPPRPTSPQLWLRVARRSRVAEWSAASAGRRRRERRPRRGGWGGWGPEVADRAIVITPTPISSSARSAHAS